MTWTSPAVPALIAALEAAWRPARAARVGGWLVRGDAAAGKRPSAVWALGDPGMPLGDAIDAAERLQRGWGQRPLAQIGPADAALDAALAARGWTVAAPCRVLVAPCADVAARGLGGRMAVRVRCPLAALDELWAEGGIGPARRAIMETTPGPKEVLLLREDDRPAAACFVAVPGPIAGLSALHVAPPFRRRGVGAALCAAAAARAAEDGAAWLALAVEAANAPALALYARLGFADAFPYHYRVAPPTPDEAAP
jgi:ribosomal protein S18 acetylase RimI-like enzyme